MSATLKLRFTSGLVLEAEADSPGELADVVRSLMEVSSAVCDALRATMLVEVIGYKPSDMSKPQYLSVGLPSDCRYTLGDCQTYPAVTGLTTGCEARKFGDQSGGCGERLPPL